MTFEILYGEIARTKFIKVIERGTPIAHLAGNFLNSTKVSVTVAKKIPAIAIILLHILMMKVNDIIM